MKEANSLALGCAKIASGGVVVPGGTIVNANCDSNDGVTTGCDCDGGLSLVLDFGVVAVADE